MGSPNAAANAPTDERFVSTPCCWVDGTLPGDLVAYVPAIFGGFVWDDDQYVTNNPTLTDLSGLRRIWFAPCATPQYYPLVFTTFWAEQHAWGLHPVGYPLVNIGLHALNAALLWRVLRPLGVPGA